MASKKTSKNTREIYTVDTNGLFGETFGGEAPSGPDNSSFGVSRSQYLGDTDFEKGGEISFSQYEVLYETSAIANQICRMPVDDALFYWRKWTHKTDDSIALKLEKAEKECRYQIALNHHMISNRKFGGSYMLPIYINDGDRTPEDLTTPMEDYSVIAKNSLLKFRHLDRWSAYKILSGTSLVDPQSEEFLAPQTVVIAYSGVNLNATRIIITDGEVALDIRQWMNNNWFNNSILRPIYRTLQRYEVMMSAGADLTRKANVDILQLSGLKTTISDPQGMINVTKRMQGLNYHYNSNMIQLIDAEDKMSHSSITVAPYKELIDKAIDEISFSTGIPKSLFVSEDSERSLGGAGVSQSNDSRYKKTLEKLQAFIEPTMNQMDKYLIASSIGYEHIDDPDLSWEWVKPDVEAKKDKVDREAIELDNITKKLMLLGMSSLVELKRESETTFNNLIASSEMLGELCLDEIEEVIEPTDPLNNELSLQTNRVQSWDKE